MRELAMRTAKKFDFRDINVARKWCVEIVGDVLILTFALFLGYTLKTMFM